MLLRPGKHTVSKYWDFDPDKRIRYRTDAEYEEHFRTVLPQPSSAASVPTAPFSPNSAAAWTPPPSSAWPTRHRPWRSRMPRLDTISWFDDSYDHIEPDSNERPDFTKVEEKRGRTGFHINLGAAKSKGIRLATIVRVRI